MRRAANKNRYNFSTSEFFNFAEGSYLERTSRPAYAIFFLAPFIVFYEIGTILINTDVLSQCQVRVVAFVWIDSFLKYLGFTDKAVWCAPALAVVVILIALQLVSRKRWHLRPGDIVPMAVECILLAAPLIVLSLFLSSPRQAQASSVHVGFRDAVPYKAVTNCSAADTRQVPAIQESSSQQQFKPSLVADIVTGIGAGIYEELIFRLILIVALMIFFQDLLRMSYRNSIILSVLFSAALFSAHHHIFFINGQFDRGGAFNWTEFGFRTMAGVYFAVLFSVRGFGITAGTHAFYDIIATVINSVFFQQ